jgi:SHS2 domain-containing protein
MARLRELSHTADVGFEVTAASLEELFEGAARGLIRALGLEAAGSADPGSDDAGERAEIGRGDGDEDANEDGNDAGEIEISRPDGERLLVQWLRELLAGAMSGRGVPVVRVREVGIGGKGPTTLRARVRWRPDAGDGPAREIKGVTYHGLAVERTEAGRWHARVVLDV